MITEVVTFKLPTGMTRDQLISNYRQTAPKWRENSDLIRKNYLYDGTNGLGGGVYLWKDIAASKKLARRSMAPRGFRALRQRADHLLL